jgi:hypothetical protein
MPVPLTDGLDTAQVYEVVSAPESQARLADVILLGQVLVRRVHTNHPGITAAESYPPVLLNNWTTIADTICHPEA